MKKERIIIKRGDVYQNRNGWKRLVVKIEDEQVFYYHELFDCDLKDTFDGSRMGCCSRGHFISWGSFHEFVEEPKVTGYISFKDCIMTEDHIRNVEISQALKVLRKYNIK